MIDDIKIYFAEVVMKKLVPMAVVGGFTALCALLAAHHDMLSKFGVDYDSQARTIDISLDILSNWMIVALGALVTSGMALVKHHAQAALSGTPQSGDMRTDHPTDGGGNRRTP